MTNKEYKSKLNKEEILFQQGIKAFNEKNFYDAHEYWEELWLDYKLEEAKFIQGLIQLAVSYYHLYNDNLNGAKSMLRKCLGKFENYDKSWGIDVNDLKNQVKDVQKHINNISISSEFKDSYIILIKVIHD